MKYGLIAGACLLFAGAIYACGDARVHCTYLDGSELWPDKKVGCSVNSCCVDYPVIGTACYCCAPNFKPPCDMCPSVNNGSKLKKIHAGCPGVSQSTGQNCS